MQRLNSIFIRLFLVFLAVILPLQGFLLTIYQWNHRTVEQELLAAASSNVVYLRDGFEDTVHRINLQLEYLVQNSVINRFFVYQASMSPADYFMNIVEINNVLLLVKQSLPLLSELRVYYVSLGRFMSSKGQTGLVSGAELEAMIAQFLGQSALLTEEEGQMRIGYMYPISSYTTATPPRYYLEARLDPDVFTEFLSSFSAYSNKNAFFLNHNTGSVLMSNDALASLAQDIQARINPSGSRAVRTTALSSLGQRYVAVTCYSDRLHGSFVQLIAYDAIFRIPNLLRRAIFWFSGMSLVLTILYLFFVHRLVNRPIRDLLQAFSAVGSGDLSARLSRRYLGEYDALAIHFNEMTVRIQSLIQLNYEATLRTQSAELKQLQAQINPHFLYNSFFLLRHMIGQEEGAQAECLAEHLGRYFQYLVRQEEDVLPLAREVDHALSYVSIQRMRFGDFLQADIAPLPDRYAQVRTPRLILQPLFENAMEYGVPTGNDLAVVRLSYLEADGLLILRVEDNGDRLSDERLAALQALLQARDAPGDSHALLNIHRRLIIFAGQSCGLRLSRSPLGGLRIDVVLHLSKGGDAT